MSVPATQRADPVLPLLDILGEIGISAAEVFDGTGLTSDDLAPGRFVLFAGLLAVLDRAVARTGRDDLGLLIGARHRLSFLDPAADVLRAAATLGQALSDFVALQPRNSSGAAIYIHRHDGQLFIGYGVHDPALRVTPALHDLTLAAATRIVLALTRGAVRPREYLTMRPAPRNPRRWATLGAPVRFGQAETGFYLSPADLAFPLPTADPAARQEALRRVLASPRFAADAWTLRTRHALRGLLLEGRSGMPDVARSLGVGDRTLRRALVREGTTFAAIRDSVRLTIAQDLLAMSRLTIGDLALTLDFATPSAFIHAFRRWTGETPAAWRARSRRPLPSTAAARDAWASPTDT
jgi:AraC-like DNA-binding protein